jgi:hypothetical protein
MNGAAAARRALVARSLDHHAPALLADASGDVVAVGVGTPVRGGVRFEEPCVTVFVRRKLPPRRLSPSRLLPRSLTAVDGTDLAVDVLELGVPTAPPPLVVPSPAAPPSAPPSAPASASVSPAALRRQVRPGRGGLSAAHWRFPAGTLTCGVIDATDLRTVYALSCNHVFGQLGGAVFGDPVLQPSRLDGGTGADAVGGFTRSAPLAFGDDTAQLADASLAYCPGDLVPGEVEGVGLVDGQREAADLRPGEGVFKVGRTTGLTHGQVLATGAWARIDYSALGFRGRSVLYRGQIVTTGMGAYGDSGSLLLDLDRRGVGLLFSGGHGGTLHNPLTAVTALLNVFVPTRRPGGPRS